jgi:hypothetical protein
MASPTPVTPATRRAKRPRAAAAVEAKPAFDLPAYVEKFKVWAQSKTVAEKQKTLADKMNKEDLKPLILTQGVRDPETGSFFLAFPEETIVAGYGKVDGVTAQRQAPKVLDVEKAETWLKNTTVKAKVDGKYKLPDGRLAKPFDLLKECQETITVFSEDKLIALRLRGIITEKQLDEFYDEKESFSFVPHKVK